MLQLVDNTVVFYMLKRISGYSDSIILDELGMKDDSNQRQRMRYGNTKNGKKWAWWPHGWDDGIFENKLLETFWKFIDETVSGDQKTKEEYVKEILKECCSEYGIDLSIIPWEKPLNELFITMIKKAKSASGKQTVLVRQNRSKGEIIKHQEISNGEMLSTEQDRKKQADLYHLYSRIPSVGNQIIGRDNEVERIVNAFSNGIRIIELCGIEGIGKETIVKKYIYEHSSEFDYILFIEYQGSFCKTLNTYLIPGMIPESGETEHDYFLRSMDVFHTLASRNTIMVVTNFNEPEDPDLDTFLSGNHKVVFTSTIQHVGIYTIPVHPFSAPQDLHALFALYYGEIISHEDEPFLEELFKATAFHTYTIELLARQMQYSFLSGKDLLGLWNEQNIAFYLGNRIPGKKGKIDSILNHLCSIFQFPHINQKQQLVLQVLYLAGSKGLTVKKLRKGCNLDDLFILNSLIQRGWVKKENSVVLSLHPIFHKMIGIMFPPSLENCWEFVDRLSDYLSYSLYRSKENNMHLFTMVWNVYTKLHPENKEALYHGLWIARYFELMDRKDDAIQYMNELLESAKKECGGNSIESLRIALSIDDVYFHNNALEKALDWYRLVSLSLEGTVENTPLAERNILLAIIYTKQACIHFFFHGQRETAFQLVNEALQMLNQLKLQVQEQEVFEPYLSKKRIDEEQINIQIVLCCYQLARFYFEDKNTEHCLCWIENGLRLVESSKPGVNHNYYSLASFHYLKGKALITKAHLSSEIRDEAIACLRQAESESITSFGLDHHVTMQIQLALRTVEHITLSTDM